MFDPDDLVKNGLPEGAVREALELAASCFGLKYGKAEVTNVFRSGKTLYADMKIEHHKYAENIIVRFDINSGVLRVAQEVEPDNG